MVITLNRIFHRSDFTSLVRCLEYDVDHNDASQQLKLSLMAVKSRWKHILDVPETYR